LPPTNSLGAGDWLRTGKSPPGNFLPARNGAKKGDAVLERKLPLSAPIHLLSIINKEKGKNNPW